MTNGVEKMADFFAARVSTYDEHMLNEVEGCREGYAAMARHIPSNAATLLDLGCGTGLELQQIWERFPHMAVTGVDLCAEMLACLRAKFFGRDATLICGDYFVVDLGKSYDVAVSFETMHHFTHEEKLALYRKIEKALVREGVYIECDYMVDTQAEEDFLLDEAKRLRRLHNISSNEFCHIDIPCTIQNQTELLQAAGFAEVTQVFKKGSTVMLVAKKSQ